MSRASTPIASPTTYPRLRTVEHGDRVEWLRMRKALWPQVSEEKHLVEMGNYLGVVGQDSGLVVLVVVCDKLRLGGFLEASLRPYAEDCETHPVGYIEGWYIDEELRRQGWGRALVHAAEHWAKENGCREMASDAVLGNEISFRSHLALGYEESSRVIHLRKFLP
ncbi:MAG: GNAT family N-acetyltransferase [Pirellulales bacterium]|nr:GNAT family N-acetyltransferase [Pirellulales bacterium]